MRTVLSMINRLGETLFHLVQTDLSLKSWH